MTAREFDDLVEQAYAKVPRRFRTRMRNIAIVVEREPSPSQLRKLAGGPGNTLHVAELALRAEVDT